MRANDCLQITVVSILAWPSSIRNDVDIDIVLREAVAQRVRSHAQLSLWRPVCGLMNLPGYLWHYLHKPAPLARAATMLPDRL